MEGAERQDPVATALELRGLCAGYRGVRAVRGVDLVVPAGSVVALIGPNGAGKTTLMSAAAGLVRASAGTIHIAGADVTAWPVHARARAGLCLVPEGRGVFPRLTVRDNLVLQTRRDRPGNISLALDAFPILGKRLSQLAGTLSGGEQQMLALARAYLSAPSVVLLDEVSMGLAPLVVDQIFTSLERLRATGVALLVVEQFVSRALAMADSVYLLNRGLVTFSGEPSQLDEQAVIRGYLGDRDDDHQP
jgi:branched-chain amino acid transport system ATP-binding protein